MSKEIPSGQTANRTDEEVRPIGRRVVIQGLAVSSCLAATGFLTNHPVSAQDARSQKPQPGDHFVFMIGEKEGQVVAPHDVKIGEGPLLVYPKDPATGKILASRASTLMLMRVNSSDLDASTKPHSADGIVAYSAICTHEGCPISGQHENPRMAICNCHGSTFDIGNNGTVVHGPATRRLAMLPVTITDGALVVAGKLNGPIGPPV
jgi:Rieske Fe-S protein